MLKFRTAAAAFASLTIITLTPVAAHADACGQCFGGCLDAYGDDNSVTGYHALSQCFNNCTDDRGVKCMLTDPSQ